MNKDLRQTANFSENGHTELNSIINCVRDKKGIDFKDYARGSLQRRILRFFEIGRISSLSDFKQRINYEDGFVEHFIDEVTVNVTEMFRDPSFWIYLRDIIIPTLSTRPIINIWHAACSTGEEVYSMAILLKEAKLYDNVRIVATDLSTKALEVAQEGIYSLKNQKVNNNNYSKFGGERELSDYYISKDKFVSYDKELLKNVKFKKHDLANNFPFSSFDLIICRNVLIYFNVSLQNKVLQLFTRSLNSNSFLGIGSKESIAWSNSEKHYEIESIEEKIFKKL